MFQKNQSKMFFFDLLQLLIQPENQIRNINGCKMFDIKIYSNKEVINHNTYILGGQALVLENFKAISELQKQFHSKDLRSLSF